jgi:hypothetical protein
MSIYIDQLQAKRRELLQAIAEIDHLLRLEGVEQSGPAPVGQVGFTPNVGKGWQTKKDAIYTVLKEAKKPLKVGELLQGIIEAGFQFRSRYPRNTLNPLIYGAKKLDFVIQTPQGFILRGRESEFEIAGAVRGESHH